MPKLISAARRRWLRASAASVLLCWYMVGMAIPAQALSTTVVISQVYGVGGQVGATLRNDYVELFNRGAAAVDITGWSVQYAAAAGTAFFSANVTNVSGSLAPGQYYLVQLASGGFPGGAPLPTPDASGTTQMSGAGKVVLVNTTTGLACNGSAGQPCSAAQLAQIVDLVGYGTTANFFEGSGPAPAPINFTADFRILNGCTETDNNATDFAIAAASPRNTAAPLHPCAGPALPNLTIDDVVLKEGSSGTTSFTFNVALSSPAGAGGITFDIATADGTAAAPSDYTAKSLTGQTIPAGGSTYAFDVLVNGDATPEAHETFLVNVTNVTGANVANGQGEGSIQDDDPRPPVAVDDSYSTDEDSALIVPAPGVLGNDIDPDNDGLTAVLVSNPTATQGTLVLNTDGSFTFTPATNFNGTASFTYAANDGTADSNVATVSITVNAVNDVPVANMQSITTIEDNVASITLVATDADNDALTYSYTQPAHGTLTGTGPIVTYTPAANYNGPDSFTFTATDGTADSNIATVSITIAAVNDNPIVVNDTATVKKNGSVTIAVLANDSDVDGDTLAITSASNGTKRGTTTINSNGTITFKPKKGFTRTDTFTYTISDGQGGTATGTVTVSVTK